MSVQPNVQTLCPMLAGPAFIRGSRMVVRLPQADAEVVAPPSFLRRLFERADGWRNFDEAAGLNGARDARLSAFMRHLLRKGVLVDASAWPAHAARAGHLPRPWGRVEGPEKSDKLRVRPRDRIPGYRAVRVRRPGLAAALAARRSTRTFSERALPMRSIAALLWSMYGIVDPGGELEQTVHRVTPSAGAFHSLNMHLLLLRRAGETGPGVFHVEFLRDGNVGLRRLSGLPPALCRAFIEPEMLEFAAGIVVISADTSLLARKYGARSYQYLLLETGHALQNAALAAPQVGLAGSDIGGYDDRRLAQACTLGDRSILGAFLFGAAPSARQAAANEERLPVEFAWVDDLKGYPLYVARARVAAPRTKSDYGWGCDRSPALAYAKAVAEAVERHALFVPRGIVRARMDELAHALRPDEIVRYAESQYQGRTFPFQRFNPMRRHTWIRAIERESGKECFVSVECVYALDALDLRSRREACTEANSSGCASATGLEEAMERATLELLERDAFMRAWAAQRGGIGIRIDSLPGELVRRVGLLRKEGCTLSLQRLSSAAAETFLAVVQHAARGFTCIGAAAGLEPLEAAAAALTEAEVMAWVRLGEPKPRRVRPGECRNAADHADLYAQRAYFRRADAMLKVSGTAAIREVAKPGRKSVDKLYERLRSQGRTVYWTDLSLAGASLAQGRQPLRTVRVIVPGLVPIAFGFGRLPLGMIERWNKGGLFPHPFS